MSRKLTCEQAGLWSLLLVSATWAASACMSRVLQAEISPLQQLMCQSMISLSVLTLVVPKRRLLGMLRPPKRHTLLLLHIRVLLGGLIGLSLLVGAYKTAPVAHIIWIQAAPLPVFWSMIIFHEKVPRQRLLLMLLAIFGLVLTAWQPSGNHSGIGSAELYATIGYCLYSLGVVLGRQIAIDLGVIRSMIWSSLLMAIYTGLAVVLFEGMIHLSSMSLVLLLLCSGTFACLNSGLLYVGYKNLPASRATILEKLSSVWGPIFAFVLFKELPNTQAILGGVIIMLAVVGAAWQREKKIAT